MLEEEKVPLVDRRLLLEGSVSSRALALVHAGLPEEWSESARCLFATYAYADLPLGKRFEFAFPNGDPEAAEPTSATVLAVTQQFAKPFDSIPHGWKTICLIDFPNGIPGVIERLPAIESWGQSRALAGLCTRETLDAILMRNAVTPA